jgi:hypothetical protein
MKNGINATPVITAARIKNPTTPKNTSMLTTPLSY